MLFVSFWHLDLANIPEGTFTHRRVLPEQSQADDRQGALVQLLAGRQPRRSASPRNEREAKNHKALCRVLGEYTG